MHLSLESVPSELHSVVLGYRTVSFPASKIIILVRYKMFVLIKCQLGGDINMDALFVSLSCYFVRA